MSDDGDDWSDYQSGPFCRHWSDPSGCEIPCARCGHACSNHGDGACMADGGRCACDEFQEDERPRDDNTIEQMTPAPSDEICDACKLRPGTRREDPYAREIAHLRVEKVMCEVCYTRACQDI